MDEHLIRLLGETQSSAETPRKHAELQLQNLYYDRAFPHSLLSIASQQSVSLPIRQSSLLTLKNFVLAGWSPSIDDFKGQILVPDEAEKDRLRTGLLSLATSPNTERRIQSAAAYVVAKIAAADFPDRWHGLLPALLSHLSGPAEAGTTYGALKVLAELVEDGLNEQQFFGVAQALVEALYNVARDESKEPILRALAVSVFKGCFDTLEMVLEDHKAAVKSFAETAIAAWMTLLKDVMRMKLPLAETQAAQEIYSGHVALKVQVVKVLMKIRIIFPAIIAPQSVELFSATWEELSSLQPAYDKMYLTDGQEGRLEDADGLAYSLDFLVAEDLDFMQSCIRAPPVRKELEAQLKRHSESNDAASHGWPYDVLQMLVFYAQMTTEEEGLWETDTNLFMSEETSVTSNYTARTACSDFVVKLAEWLVKQIPEALLAYTRSIFSSNSSWRIKESSLLMLGQIISDWQDVDRKMDPQLFAAFFEFAQHATQHKDPFLRARGFVVASIIVMASGEALYHVGASLLETTLRAVVEDDSDIVRVSCIRALQHLLSSLPSNCTLQYQSAIISCLASWVASQDSNELGESDDLIIAVLETLRDALLLDTRIAVTQDGLTLLFKVATKGASNFQITTQVVEVFEEICSTIAAAGNEEYTQLIDRVLPSLIDTLDATPNIAEENPLTNLAAELLSSLTSNATTPLPPTFIPTIIPKLTPHLLYSTSSDVLKSTTLTLRNLVQNDAQQVFFLSNTSTSTPTSGLESILHIISRLLSPSVPDASASEVGTLAATLVEQAGAELLGPYLPQLLEAIARRLATAEHAQLIQSLLLVFARLCLTNAKDVVEFLASLEDRDTAGNSTTALHTILTTWLANSTTFAGASAITLNVQALARIYMLHDPRVAAISVKGDLIINQAQNGRIMTRSRAKQNPDTWTTVSADVKIVKVLADEIVPPGNDGMNALSSSIREHTNTNGTHDEDTHLNSDDDDSEDDNDDWEDEPGILDLGLGSTKESLMKWGNEDDEGTSASRRDGNEGDDDETQVFLSRFFGEVVKEEGFERGVWGAMSAGEREKVENLLAR